MSARITWQIDRETMCVIQTVDGVPLAIPVGDNPNRKEIDAKRQRLLGERVESTLKSLGITKEAYLKIKKAIGAEPTCGCDARKEWLNKASLWWRQHKEA